LPNFLRLCLLKALFIATASAVVASGDDDRLHTQPLVAIAVRYGMPMPPKTARLVLAGTGQEPEVYSPAFLLEERADGRTVVLRGFRKEAVTRNRRADPLWRPFDPKLGQVDFHRISTFVCAVQLAARGDDEKAQFLWKQVVNAGEWTDRQTDSRHPYETESPELFLGHCILDDLRMAYLRPGTDWREINRRRRALVKDLWNLDWDARATIYGDLLETLYAKPANPESTEGLLLDWSRRPHTGEPGRFFDFDDCNYDGPADAPARKIILRGFNGLPDLLRLVDDQRLTAHARPNSEDPLDNARLGDLAQQLLAEITGQSSTSHGAEEIAGWRAWWEKSRPHSEADVFAKAVFERDRDTITSVNEGPAWILAHKYPSRLPALLDECVRLASTDEQPFELAEAMAASTLDQVTKERALIEGVKKGSMETQRWLLQALAGVNTHKCADLLLPILQNLPSDSGGPYRNCVAAHFTYTVTHVENDEVWHAFLAAAKRSSPALRLEMMEAMDYGYLRNKNRERGLAFLSAFLDDSTVRRIPQGGDIATRLKYENCAASTFPEMEARNFAAMEIACILELCDSPNPSWTQAQWAGLRTKVRAKLAQEKLPNLETRPTAN
jgi:hypothetical protein